MPLEACDTENAHEVPWNALGLGPPGNDVAQREPVPYRQRFQPDERAELPRLPAPLHGSGISSEWVRAIEHDRLHARRRRRAHGEHRRPHERVIPGPDVLEIDDEYIDVGQVFRARRQVLEPPAVEATNGCSEHVACVGNADHVLRLTAIAVLGAEDDDHANAQCIEDAAHVYEAPIDGGWMGEKANPRGA